MNKKVKAHLINELKEILLTGTVSTQEEIKHLLEQQGYEINQSKISRLLHKVGAVKLVNDRKQIVYALQREPAPPNSRAIWSELITSISKNDALIVIHTNPGSASLIGRLLDHHRNELEILGTVAGDDTIFIAPINISKIARTLKKIQEFLNEST